MKKIWHNLPLILLIVFIAIYSIYFSLFTINRYQKLYAHYYDLGIMHHTVYNTYKALQTGDMSRILELTNPHSFSADQVKRMSIHNDILLAFFAPFYFIHEGPETLLVLQAVGVAVGAFFIYKITNNVFKDVKYRAWIGLVFGLVYLLYPPLQKANSFEFHAVTFVTTIFLAMFYFWLVKRYVLSFFFVILALLTKEQVGLTVAAFGVFILVDNYKFFSLKQIARTLPRFKSDPALTFAVSIIIIGVIWVILSVFVIIPLARGQWHFASGYYDHIINAPWKIPYFLTKHYVIKYMFDLLGPVGFLSVAAPLQLLIAAPEFAINLLSSNSNMRNIYFHYDTVITAFVFISMIYGVKNITGFVEKIYEKARLYMLIILLTLTGATSLIFSFTSSTLPYARLRDIYPWKKPQDKYEDIIYWKKMLDQDQIKVSTTGHLAPHFTSRQYFYDFSWKYVYADYLVLDRHDARYGYLKKSSLSAYKALQVDPDYIKIYDRNGIEVYKKSP